MFNFIKDNLFLCFILFLLVVLPPGFIFKSIGFVLLGILILIVVGVLVLRWKIRQFTRQAGGQTSQQWGQQGAQQSRRTRRSADDDVEIFTTSSNSATSKRVSSDVGDYVDFEEIKDKR